MGRSTLKFLIDTNIFIPLEPATIGDLEPGTRPAAEFLRQAQERDCGVFVHPATLADFARDKDDARRNLRATLFNKYRPLPDPPAIAQRIEAMFGAVAQGHNDWVDHHLLAAVTAEAIDWLVTEDSGIHTKAKRLGIADRVLRLSDAIAILGDLFGRLPVPPPAVEAIKAHALDPADAIFTSLRDDYPGFDDWFTRARRAHRQSWVIRSGGLYDALAVVKDEDDTPHGLSGRVLKICTFKVSERSEGLRYGELLLKTIFSYAVENRHDCVYVTVLPKHEYLLLFLADFGFEVVPHRTALGELVLAKPMRAEDSDDLAFPPIDFHRRFGPRLLRFDSVPVFTIPIRPEYHSVLFPDAAPQLDLTAGRFPAGNGIRKAYLCHAPISEIPAGAPLLFYLSGGRKAITVLGVAEEAILSPDRDVVARFVGKRTVYSYAEISQMCADAPVRAILFRQSRILAPPLKLSDLVRAGLLKAHPQSITQLPKGAGEWLATKLGR